MSAKEKIRVQMQVDKELKEEATEIFDELGLSNTTAYTLFLKQVVAQGKIPFELSLSRKSMAQRALREAAQESPERHFETAEEFAEYLEGYE